MGNAITVILGGSEYAIPHLNVGQLERVTDLFETKAAQRVSFGVLRIAFERAVPKPASVDEIEAAPDEIAGAVRAILTASGLTPKEPARGEA